MGVSLRRAVPRREVRPAADRSAALRALDNLEELIAAAALVLVVLSVAWGVLTRYVMAQPAAWTGEVAAMAFAWVVFLGAAAGVKRGLHVSIELLVARLPDGLRRLLQRIVDLGLLVWMLYVAWLGVGFTADNWDNPSSVLRLPLSVVYAAVTLGFALMAVRHTARMLGRGPVFEREGEGP